jgi:hypothetical protein
MALVRIHHRIHPNQWHWSWERGRLVGNGVVVLYGLRYDLGRRRFAPIAIKPPFRRVERCLMVLFERKRERRINGQVDALYVSDTLYDDIFVVLLSPPCMVIHCRELSYVRDKIISTPDQS